MILRDRFGVAGVSEPLGTSRAANLRGNWCGDDKNRDDERERAANHLRTSIVFRHDPQPADPSSLSLRIQGIAEHLCRRRHWSTVPSAMAEA